MSLGLFVNCSEVLKVLLRLKSKDYAQISTDVLLHHEPRKVEQNNKYCIDSEKVDTQAVLNSKS